MRWLAWLLTPLTLVAAAWSGEMFYRVWQAPLPPAPASVAAPLDALALDLPQPEPPMRWPSLFGSFTPPEPQPPRPPAPVLEIEPQPPAPPLETLGYALKGLVDDGDNRWAIVGHPTGDRLLRVGDSLAEGVIVKEIETGGIRIDNRGHDAFMAFDD